MTNINTLITFVAGFCLLALVFTEVSKLVSAVLKVASWPKDVKLERPKGHAVRDAQGKMRPTKAYKESNPANFITISNRVKMCLYGYACRSVLFHEFHLERLGQKPLFVIRPYLALALLGFALGLVCGEEVRMALNWALVGSFSTFASFEARSYSAYIAQANREDAAVREMIQAVNAR